jgi:D-alanyl-lipoteichoic acid acyltransferase DltB (MBOAT superfamily)
MMPQFDSIRNKIWNQKNIRIGIFLFAIGLFKKLALADTFAIWANSGFDHVRSLTMVEAWLVSLSYTFQLYFDFSGYTDMALGLSLLFNVKLPINFDSPYKAQDIQEFWRRWHMTLSHFFTDYVYIPLGGNRGSDGRTYVNLMVVFLVGGLWHGAGWLFLVWGMLHGAASVVFRFWRRLNIKLHWFLSLFITFNFVNLAWVFFRSKDVAIAKNILRSMFNFSHVGVNAFGLSWENWLKVVFICIGFAVTLGFRNSNEMAARAGNGYQWAAVSGALFAVAMVFMTRSSPFLYFQF